MSNAHKNSEIGNVCRGILGSATSLIVLGLAVLASLPENLQAGVAVRGPRGGAAAVNVGRRPVAAPAARGTARRTTRRTMRRLTVLPRGYRTAVVAGTTYYVVENVYYKPYYEGSQVVYVEVEVNR